MEVDAVAGGDDDNSDFFGYTSSSSLYLVSRSVTGQSFELA